MIRATFCSDIGAPEMAVPCVGWILDRIKISYAQMRNAA